MDQLTSEDPSRIGPYRLIARLGAGGMGLVYLARSDGGRTVAVKAVQAEFAQLSEFRSRFAREVEAARKVGGVWTAPVLDADTGAGTPWVATGYIPGPDLHTVVGVQHGPLPEESVCALAHGLAQALRAIHGAGLIHRDLKPSNVLVTVDGPRVIDFGIARALETLAEGAMTRTGAVIGSPGFMSPEQVRGLKLTSASDVFCLGSVLAYAVTGRSPFGTADSGLHALLFRVAEEEPDLAGVPESLLGLVRQCLEKDPALRPSPQEVAARTVSVTAPDEPWLPGKLLGQLGRHAAQLLDFEPQLPRPATVLDPAPPPVPAEPVPASASPRAIADAPTAGPGRSEDTSAPGRRPTPKPLPRRRSVRMLGAVTFAVLAVVAAGLLGPELLPDGQGPGSTTPVPSAFHGHWEGRGERQEGSGQESGAPYARLVIAKKSVELALLDRHRLCVWETRITWVDDTSLTLDHGTLRTKTPADVSGCLLQPKGTLTKAGATLTWKGVTFRSDFRHSPRASPEGGVPDAYRTWWSGRGAGGTDLKLGIGYERTRRAVDITTLSRTKQRCRYSAETFAVHEGKLLVSHGEQKPGSSASECADSSPALVLDSEGKGAGRMRMAPLDSAARGSWFGNLTRKS